MKARQLKLPVILVAISLVSFISLFRCGQADKTKEPEAKTDPAIQVVDTPAVAVNAPVDSPGSVTANQVNLKDTGKTKPEIKTDPKKNILPADKKPVTTPVNKPTVEQPVVNNKKTTPNTNVTPVVEKPVTKTVETPVVKVPEPVKTNPETQPKTNEVVKPVTPVNPQPEQEGWIVPAKYKTMTSPYAVNNESLDLGKSLYGTHCKSCHGVKGEGNGPKSSTIDTKIRSFLSAEFLLQKPGEVYYKTIIGRNDMPKFEKKIPDEEDRWALVHYIMNLKK